MPPKAKPNKDAEQQATLELQSEVRGKFGLSSTVQIDLLGWLSSATQRENCCTEKCR
jgi:hypothetical protein